MSNDYDGTVLKHKHTHIGKVSERDCDCLDSRGDDKESNCSTVILWALQLSHTSMTIGS